MTNKLSIVKEDPWYKDGLSFECTGCGKCCSGSPGYVWVDHNDIEQMAEYLKLPINQFKRRYLRQKNGRYALIELPSMNYSCVFLQDNRCTVYPVRPAQCRTFPWWISNLSSKEAWNEAAKRCEGIQPNAPKYTQEKIESELSVQS